MTPERRKQLLAASRLGRCVLFGDEQPRDDHGRFARIGNANVLPHGKDENGHFIIENGEKIPAPEHQHEFDKVKAGQKWLDIDTFTVKTKVDTAKKLSKTQARVIEHLQQVGSLEIGEQVARHTAHALIKSGHCEEDHAPGWDDEGARVLRLTESGDFKRQPAATPPAPADKPGNAV